MKRKVSRNRRAIAEPAPQVETDKAYQISKMLDTPANSFSDASQIEFIGNREAVIDGCKGVLEYDENIVKINTAKMIVKFTGRGLQLKCMTPDSAVIEGFIISVEFLVN